MYNYAYNVIAVIVPDYLKYRILYFTVSRY